MKVLVTGGAGYIGSHVVLALCEEGNNVVVLDDLSTGNREAVDKRALFIQGSTLNDNDLSKGLNDVDAVIHLAAFKAAGESMIHPEKYSHNNITGTITLLNAMVKHGVNKFIFSSTAAVYGYPKYLPLDENHSLEPINYYGFTKLEIERILEWYGELKGLRFAALRYFNAAGYDSLGRITSLENNPENLIPIVMEVASGRRKKMEVFGDDYDTDDGTGVRDYIHVTDLATAHVKCIEYLNENRSLTVNLATGESHSVMDIINLTKEISGRDIPFDIVDRRSGDPAKLYASTNQAFKALNWEAEYSDLKTLLETTWKVYQ